MTTETRATAPSPRVESPDDAPDDSPGDTPPPDARHPGNGTARRDALVALHVAAALAVSVVVAWLSVRLHGAPATVGFDEDGGWTDVLVGLVLIGTGQVVLRGDRRGRAIGVVMVANGWLWLLTALASLWVVERLTFSPGLPGAPLALDIVYRWGSVILFGLPLVLLLFPDGRLPRRPAGRAVAIASLVLTGVLPFLVLIVPSSVADAGSPAQAAFAALHLDLFSVPMPAGSWPTLRMVGIAALLLGTLGAFVVVVARYRASTGTRRLQMRWLLWAGLVDVLAIGTSFVAPGVAETVSLTVAIVATAGAVMVAVARYRLYEIDRLLSTTVVAGLLGALVLLVDGAVLLVAGTVMGGRDSALVAVAVVAVLYTPLRNRLWTLARRLTRGGRDDPYGAVATLADRLESAVAPGEQLAALARSVAEAFRLPHVRVEIDRADGARAEVEYGVPEGEPVTLPIRYRDETIGRVVVSGARGLADADQRLLGDLLRQAAAAARAGALGASLQQARAALVSAREEERRRLRRDLHDSLGPGLAAVTLRIETARALAAKDPARADTVLDRATTDVTTLLADVRRLVHDLRPPALDELGLAGALREQADKMSGARTVHMVVDAADLGPLPAAVEVAAYRIVCEALTNVVKHAAATRATATLRRGPDGLDVTVADDGRGIAPDVAAGVGTASLRERAAELGGRSTLTCPADGGTVVTAHLPVPAEPATEEP